MLKSGQLGDCPDVIRSFCSNCHTRFPMATPFKPPLIAFGEDAVSGAVGMHPATRSVRVGHGTTDDVSSE